MSGVCQTEFQLPAECVGAFLVELHSDGWSEAPVLPEVCFRETLDLTAPAAPGGAFFLGFWPSRDGEARVRCDLHWRAVPQKGDRYAGHRVAAAVQEIALRHGATVVFGLIEPLPPAAV